MEQQNTKKLSDKAFVRLIFTSILGILVCIVCLCSTTYAWFTGSVQSDSNKIQSASECKLSAEISIKKVDGEKETEEPITVDIETPRTLENGSYSVTLTLPAGSASGYIVFSVTTADGQVKDYYTDYLQRSDVDQELTFTLNVETTQNVTVTARWGIYSGTSDVDVKDGVPTMTIQ